MTKRVSLWVNKWNALHPSVCHLISVMLWFVKLPVIIGNLGEQEVISYEYMIFLMYLQQCDNALYYCFSVECLCICNGFCLWNSIAFTSWNRTQGSLLEVISPFSILYPYFQNQVTTFLLIFIRKFVSFCNSFSIMMLLFLVTYQST